MALLKIKKSDGTWEAIEAPNSVKYTSQALTSAQQEQARKNIGIDNMTNTDKRSTIVVGSAINGYTSADCDYLCDGMADEDEINSALKKLGVNGGTVSLLPGHYNITNTVKLNVNHVCLDGNGAIIRGTSYIDVQASYCQISNITFIPRANVEQCIRTLNGGWTTIKDCTYAQEGDYYAKRFIFIDAPNCSVLNCRSISPSKAGGGIEIHAAFCNVSECMLNLYDGSTISTGGTAGIFIPMDSGAEFCKIANNIIIMNATTTSGYGIKLATNYNLVTSNIVKAVNNSYSYGIFNAFGTSMITNNVIDAYSSSNGVLNLGGVPTLDNTLNYKF